MCIRDRQKIRKLRGSGGHHRALVHGAVKELVAGAPQGFESIEIAKRLKALGCEGSRGDPKCCPVGKLVRYLCGEEKGARYVVCPLAGIADKEADLVMLVPDSLRKFIFEFDKGAYPQLEVTNEY